MILKNIITLIKHKYYVIQAGRRVGRIPLWRLLVHDLSKFSPAEFIPYTRQFHGGGNNPAEFARAWLHHIHHNPHHWQYWIFPDGYAPAGAGLENGVVPMPEVYLREMVADWLGANRTYNGSYDISSWLKPGLARMILHSETSEKLTRLLAELGYSIPTTEKIPEC